ncbi:MAG: alpha/beta fold hydrolase [Tannerellaceae bacterium]|nr:alpha/beta fold hydrolase [Tannerellaceae bacterium]
MSLSLPLDLLRVESEDKRPARPQEPSGPYAYYEEEVSFENQPAGIMLAGTLTLPRKEGSFPVVILISGSGAQDRNEEVFGHRPFLIIADYLTNNGIAVLRFDDRGTASSTGSFVGATTGDFASDVEAGVKYLMARKEIDHSRIGLVGHSEGGIIAPIVAARSTDISFIVLLAGSGLRGDSLLLLQQEAIAGASGVSEENVRLAQSINRSIYDMIIQTDDTDRLAADISAYLRRTIALYPGMKPSGMDDDAYVISQTRQATDAWFRYFIRLDPSVALEKVTCPVLALNGEKDLQVPAGPNLRAIGDALARGGNKRVTAKEYPGLNHMFQQCVTCSTYEYGVIEQTFSPTVLKDISDWIKSGAINYGAMLSILCPQRRHLTSKEL